VVRRLAVDLGAGGHPVGADQRAVQGQVRRPGGVCCGDDLVQAGGVGGDDVETLVQVAVAGRVADADVASEGVQVAAMTQPAQHQHHLGVHRGRPLPGPRARPALMPGDPAGHGLENGCGHVQVGTMGHGELLGKRSVFSEITLTPGARPHISASRATSADVSGQNTARECW
jgi:hypothetical protein